MSFEPHDLTRAASLVIGLTLAQGASAQSTAPTDATQPAAIPESRDGNDTATNSAELLFRSGREALQRGDYAQACAKLAESDRIEPSPGAKLNRALCEEPLGHVALAWQLLQLAIGGLAPDDERVLIAQRHADELRGKLAFLTVTLRLGSPGTARVTADGVELASSALGAPAAFDPGEHLFEVTASGYTPKPTEVTLAAGDTRLLELSVGAASLTPVATRRPDAAPSRSSSWRSVGFGLTGAAAALAVTSLVTGVLAYDAKQDMARGCDAAAACSEEGINAAARGKSYSAISTGSFVGALIAGGVGTVLLLTQRNPPDHRTASAHGLRWEF